jgi:ketosteroid isomerase-like protein
MRRSTLILATVLAAALPAQAIAKAPDLPIEQRLQRAEDELAIRRILVEYAWTQDARDFAAYAALFAAHGEWINGTMVRKGPDEIKKMLVGIYGDPQPGFVNRESFHITTNPEVNVNGDHATARSRHLLITRGPDGRPQPTLAGRYEDELIRENGKWKILRRIDYPVMPTAEEWGKLMRARGLGK